MAAKRHAGGRRTGRNAAGERAEKGRKTAFSTIVRATFRATCHGANRGKRDLGSRKPRGDRRGAGCGMMARAWAPRPRRSAARCTRPSFFQLSRPFPGLAPCERGRNQVSFSRFVFAQNPQGLRLTPLFPERRNAARCFSRFRAKNKKKFPAAFVWSARRCSRPKPFV